MSEPVKSLEHRLVAQLVLDFGIKCQKWAEWWSCQSIKRNIYCLSEEKYIPRGPLAYCSGLTCESDQSVFYVFL